jgi:hypothetical protein
MPHDPVELVAQAFYAAEHSGEWSDQPDVLKQQFREFARAAIAMLGQETIEIQPVAMVPQGGNHGQGAQLHR